ncbi:MAG: spore coat protein [Lachnospiraceae bacterium]|nr:spore coat protein [Lachnospiraceae bacterium]
MILNQKETTLLKDIKSQEKLCVDKYTACAEEASDPKLKQLFKSIGSTEQQHLNTVEQLLNGTIPQLGSSSGSKQNTPGSSASAIDMKYNPSSNTTAVTGDAKTHDKYLCSDTLASEKHVSSVYNTSIFEFRDEKVRDVLNHIQTEEQEHGKQIYDYMSQHDMYNN